MILILVDWAIPQSHAEERAVLDEQPNAVARALARVLHRWIRFAVGGATACATNQAAGLARKVEGPARR